MKSLVFITARLPYPASSGRKNVMYNYCKILHEVFDYKITVISFLEAGDSVEPKPDFIDDVIILPAVSGKRKLINLIKYTFYMQKYPMQVSLYHDPDNQSTIDRVIENVKPDLLMTDMVRTTEYGRQYNGYKIADLDDMLSLRYKRQMAMELDTINPYGAYLYSLPKFLQKVCSLNFIKKLVLSNEVKLLEKYEREISLYYDKVVFVADGEARRLNREMNFDKALAVPLGVDVDYFGEYYGKLEIKKHTIGFLGAMSVAHNESGAIHFAKNIMPLVLKRIPDAKFIVVGGGITQQLRAFESESVIFTGRVEDVRTTVGECEVFVCPLTFGSGIKTKNLEAMAMGVPVVTTSIGAENIDAENGISWLVADEDREFADAVVAVLENQELRTRLSENGREFVKNNFTWNSAEEAFKSVL